MPAPTFLCIGAQKCGTTWLARAVQQHPQVAPGKKKELHFFSQQEAWARGLSWYESQFRTVPGARAVGEFTPNYWWTVGTPTAFHVQGSAERIADAYPHLQLIVCVRDPVERAVSAYFHHMKAGRYPPTTSLLQAALAWPDIREFGRYGTQLQAWLRVFPLESFLFLVYEDDIVPDEVKPRTVRRVFEHIGVESSFAPRDMVRRRNVRSSDFDIRLRHAGPMRRRLMTALPERTRDSPRWSIPVEDRDIETLRAEYAPETELFEQLVGRRMSWGR